MGRSLIAPSTNLNPLEGRFAFGPFWRRRTWSWRLGGFRVLPAGPLHTVDNGLFLYINTHVHMWQYMKTFRGSRGLWYFLTWRKHDWKWWLVLNPCRGDANYWSWGLNVMEYHGMPAFLPEHLGNEIFYFAWWNELTSPFQMGTWTFWLVELAQVRDVKENRYKAKDVVAIKRGFDVPGAQLNAWFRIVPMGGCLMGKHHGFNHPVFPSRPQ